MLNGSYLINGYVRKPREPCVLQSHSKQLVTYLPFVKEDAIPCGQAMMPSPEIHRVDFTWRIEGLLFNHVYR